jgi:hypothetical protein
VKNCDRHRQPSAELTVNNRVKPFEFGLGLPGDSLHLFPERSAEFLILQATEIDPDIHRGAFDARAHSEQTDAHI